MEQEMHNQTPPEASPNPEAARQDQGPLPVEAPFEAEVLQGAALEELRQKAAKAEEYYDRLLRLAADFDNFKKRAARERQEAIKFANAGLLEKLLPVMDHFEMALAAIAQPANGNTAATQTLQAGITMVYQQLRQLLLEAGLEEIDALGKTFDPSLHEAVAQEATAEAPEGQVVKQLRKGYRLKERLLRPASVVVAVPPAPAASKA
ncbi:MAG: nucleotide exchange factor GrpE [Verrucomicrobiae bacterium]|nr:nucleotide exchange factor GrpE [Verrucomicrobiae bacterium]